MRKNFILNGFLATAVLTGGAFAQGQQQKVEFYLDGKVGTETVKKGTYTVTLPEGQQGQVEIKVGKKVVAVNATKKEINDAPAADKMTYRDNGDGTRSVATLTPKGKKFTLVFDAADVAAKPQATPAKPGSENR